MSKKWFRRWIWPRKAKYFGTSKTKTEEELISIYVKTIKGGEVLTFSHYALIDYTNTLTSNRLSERIRGALLENFGTKQW